MSEEVWSLANVDRDALHMLGTYIFRILMSSFVAIIVHVAGLLTLATAFSFFLVGYQSSKNFDQAVSCLFPGQGGSRGGPGGSRGQEEARGPWKCSKTYRKPMEN